MPQPPEPISRRNLWLFLGLGLALALSLMLALNRVYQVDEAQNAYSAWIQGSGLSSQMFTPGSLYLLPFGWAVRHSNSAEDVFDLLRLGFWGLWWVNLGLLALAAGVRPWSRKGGLFILAVLLVPPLWTYGLEARHENVILAGVMAMWAVARWGRGPGWLAFAALGAVSALLQASAFKSAAYWLPISLGALLLPHPSHGPRPRLAAGWVAGAGTAALLVVGVEHASGLWPSFWAEQTRFLHGAAQVQRFSPVDTLLKLLRQCPVILALAFALGLWVARRGPLPKDRKSFYEGAWPELVFALGCLALLFFVNPNPFPYNLLIVSASLILLVAALLSSLGVEIQDRAVRRALLAAAVAAQAIPAAVQVSSLLHAGNDRQVALMQAAEALTGPGDRVYDSAGLVPTRKSVGYVWFMNIASVQAFRNGSLPPFLETFNAEPPAVIIPTYRFSYLDPQDEKEVESRYVALAPDLWAAGHLFTGARETWQCSVGGRYKMKILAGQGPAARLDGRPLPEGAFFLLPGSHSWVATGGTQAVLVWLGPRLNDVPSLQGEPTPGVFPIPNAF